MPSARLGFQHALDQRRRRTQQRPDTPLDDPGIVPQYAGVSSYRCRYVHVSPQSPTCPPGMIKPVFEELARSKGQGRASGGQQEVAFVKVDLDRLDDRA